MKIAMSQFAGLKSPVNVTVHSLAPALYQVTLSIDGHDKLLTTDDGKPYRAKNLQSVREMLASMPVQAITMRHESPYDEMVGQPARHEGNALEVGLAPLEQSNPVIH